MRPDCPSLLGEPSQLAQVVDEMHVEIGVLGEPISPILTRNYALSLEGEPSWLAQVVGEDCVEIGVLGEPI
jgi:hypothetical protein